jgi:gamma-glutamyl-gamma-aminobutyrate hydrolase PuuD
VSRPKPFIATCASFLRDGMIAGWEEAIAFPVACVTALRRAGAQEAILAPVTPGGDIDLILRNFDGLLLAGGQDLDPACYREEPHPCTGVADRARDDLEIALARAAIALGMPVLALCRGMQILNVCRGGSLIQHLPDVGHLTHYSSPLPGGPSTVHDVQIESGSTLAQALGVETTTVVSRHHQAIARLGGGFRAVARSDDGVIEGIELEDRWVVGVQWHPELSVSFGDEHQRLFDEFVLASESATIARQKERTADRFLEHQQGSSSDDVRIAT